MTIVARLDHLEAHDLGGGMVRIVDPTGELDEQIVEAALLMKFGWVLPDDGSTSVPAPRRDSPGVTPARLSALMAVRLPGYRRLPAVDEEALASPDPGPANPS